MKTLLRALGAASLAMATVGSAPGQSAIVELTPHETFRAGTQVFADRTVIAGNAGTALSEVMPARLGALPPGSDVDAYAVQSGVTYFSLTADRRLGGTYFADEDLIAWNGSVYSLAWSGAAHGVPREADLDAVDVITAGSPMRLALSFDIPVTLAGVGRVNPGDAVTWAGAFSLPLYFDAGAAGLPPSANLDGISTRLTGTLVLSFDTDLQIGATRFEDADLLTFNQGSGVFSSMPYFKASTRGIGAWVDVQDMEASSTVPLLVELLRLECLPVAPGSPVALEWETGTEVDNAGFHVYRALPGAHHLGERLTTDLIPALGPMGGVYGFTDPAPLVDADEVRGYFIEDVDTRGVATLHGPVWSAVLPDASVEGWTNY